MMKSECPKCEHLIRNNSFQRHFNSCDGTGPYRRLTKNHADGYKCTTCTRIFSTASGFGKHQCNPTFRLDRMKREANGEYTRVYLKTCSKTNVQFYTSNKNATIHPSLKVALRTYRARCSFSFNVYDYPNQFDLDLITKYGWYSPGGRNSKNKNINMNGVSRDHLFSVYDGWINDIDPRIISHPANCRLILQSENASKRNSSSITLDELLQRIAIWNGTR